MPKDPFGTCRVCKAPVIWLRNTATGRTAPIDAEPNDKGDVAVDLETRTYTVPFPGFVGKTIHTRHYNTCPEQEYWRQRVNRRHG